MLCLTSARFNMKADILRQTNSGGTDITDAHGEWENQVDPFSGEIIRVWVPVVEGQQGSTSEDVEQATFPCIARGVTTGGIRAVGTTERWSELYEGVDYVVVQFPANVKISRRDRVTNIRDSRGTIMWKEEETFNDDDTNPPTIFEVVGVTPIPDPFGQHVENMALLQRAEAQ